MDLLKHYAESSSDDEPLEPISKRVAIGSLAPEVDISDLQLIKHQEEANRFARETNIDCR